MIIYIAGSALFLVVGIIGARAIAKHWRQENKQRAIASSYDRLVRNSKLSVEFSDFFSGRYIGLDKRNRKLVLIDHCNGEKQELCIPLSEVADSEIVHIKDESEGIKTILLKLINKRNNGQVQFCFYDKEFDPVLTMPSLSRKAFHWKTRVDIHRHPGNFSVKGEYVL